MEATGDETNSTNITNVRYVSPLYNLSQEDSNWIVTSSFMIFTMQTGNIENSSATLSTSFHFVKVQRCDLYTEKKDMMHISTNI